MARHPEVSLQIAMVRWMRAVAPGCIVHHSPNGEVRDKRTAAKLKAMGVFAGWPDLTVIDPFGRFHLIEVKADKGRLSEAQQGFAQACRDRGIRWAACRSIDDAREAFRVWGIQMREAS